MAGNISRGFGIDWDTAAFLMLEAAAVASGNAFMVRTPEGGTLGPEFNLALVSDGAGFPGGALAALMSPVTMIVGKACLQERDRGKEATRNCLEAVLTSRHETRTRLANQERQLREVKARNEKAERLADRMRDRGETRPEDFAEIRATGRDFEAERTLEANVARDRETLRLMEGDLQTLQLAAAPGILTDEPDWNMLPELPQGSFDQLTMAVSFSGLRQLPLMSRKGIGSLARALMGAQTGKPGLSMIASGTSETFSQVLGNPAVRNSGIFLTFAFVESVEPGICDPMGIDAVDGDPAWSRLCGRLFALRMAQSQKVLLLDHPGFQAYVAFRAWVRQECPPPLRPSFECWPNLCLRLALIRAILAGADSIAREHVERAAEYLKSRLAATALLIETITAGETPEQQRESRIGRICRRLTNGPLTKRGIARTMHRQDYSVIERMLDEALHAGRIERRGDFFYLVNVGVSAAAARL